MYGMCACYPLACHLLQSRQKTAAKEKEKTETARALEAMEQVSHGGGGGGGWGYAFFDGRHCMHAHRN